MGPPENLWEGVFAADMEKHYLWTREKYRVEHLKEAMLAWVKSVPMAQCSLLAMEKITERRFNDLVVFILTEATPDERLRIWPGMSPTTIPITAEVVVGSPRGQMSNSRASGPLVPIRSIKY